MPHDTTRTLSHTWTNWFFLFIVVGFLLAVIFAITLSVNSGTTGTRNAVNVVKQHCGQDGVFCKPEPDEKDRVQQAVKSLAWLQQEQDKEQDAAASEEHRTYVRGKSRVLILRQFYDTHEDRRALTYFFEHGLHVVDDETVKLYVVSNGPFPSSDIQVPACVTLLERENEGLDFGAYADTLERLGSSVVDAFDYVFLFNGTVAGPMIPRWLPEAQQDWLHPFLAPLDDDLRLMGISVNHYETRIHVQSMVLALSVPTLRMVQEWGFLTNPLAIAKLDKEEIIDRYEVGLGEQLIQHGYNLGSVLPVQRGIDYRRMKEPEYREHVHSAYPNELQQEVWGRFRYFGREVPIYDAVFTKYNRHFDAVTELALSTQTRS